MEDHPRSRGVYRLQVAREERLEGSSPLARGLRQSRNWGVPMNGIIPARAGFTKTTRTMRLVTKDHPRSRGVYC